MDDDELIAAVARGEESALRELFVRHAPWLAARLRRVLPVDAVEDVMQETFVAVWRGAGRYLPQGRAGGWLWVIAARQAAMWLRRTGRDVTEDLSALADVAVAGPESAVLDRVVLAQAVEALGQAGSPERQVWELLFLADLPVAEVARRLGLPTGTVKSRAWRVRRLLRAQLGRSGVR